METETGAMAQMKERRDKRGKATPREASVEFYRVALMFGICLLHSITFSDHVRPWLANILLSCVNGFVLISGWHGIRFTPSKALRLYGTSLYAALVVWGIGWGRAGTMLGVTGGLQVVWGQCKAPWFLNAYLFLMLLAPLVDAALKHLDDRRLPYVVFPFFVLTFGWSFGHELPILSAVLPTTPGLGNYTGLTLLCVYVFGGLCRRLGVERISLKVLLIILLPLLLLTAIGMGDYASPFATLLATTTFLLFKRMNLSAWGSRVVFALAPSMFSVYLLHTNQVGISFMLRVQEILLAGGWVPLYLAFSLSALVIFVVAVLVDLFRRVLCRTFNVPLSVVCRWIDIQYDEVMNWIGKKLPSDGRSAS